MENYINQLICVKHCPLFQLLTCQHSCTYENLLARKKLLKGKKSIEEWIS